jgi:hypothetical protein
VVREFVACIVSVPVVVEQVTVVITSHRAEPKPLGELNDDEMVDYDEEDEEDEEKEEEKKKVEDLAVNLDSTEEEEEEEEEVKENEKVKRREEVDDYSVPLRHVVVQSPGGRLANRSNMSGVDHQLAALDAVPLRHVVVQSPVGRLANRSNMSGKKRKNNCNYNCHYSDY